MAAIQISNNLGLAPPKAKPSIQPIQSPNSELISQPVSQPISQPVSQPISNPVFEPARISVPESRVPLEQYATQLINQPVAPQIDHQNDTHLDASGPPQTEFAFELPIGYVDNVGRSHRHGVMRLARTVDEIGPMSDPRVQANPAYATVIILAQVILSLGTLPDVSPIIIEGMFAGDLNYLQKFYRKINRLEDE